MRALRNRESYLLMFSLCVDSFPSDACMCTNKLTDPSPVTCIRPQTTLEAHCLDSIDVPPLMITIAEEKASYAEVAAKIAEALLVHRRTTAEEKLKPRQVGCLGLVAFFAFGLRSF